MRYSPWWIKKLRLISNYKSKSIKIYSVSYSKKKKSLIKAVYFSKVDIMLLRASKNIITWGVQRFVQRFVKRLHSHKYQNNLLYEEICVNLFHFIPLQSFPPRSMTGWRNNKGHSHIWKKLIFLCYLLSF